jgi:hypothetical protein
MDRIMNHTFVLHHCTHSTDAHRVLCIAGSPPDNKMQNKVKQNLAMNMLGKKGLRGEQRTFQAVLAGKPRC